MKKLVTALLLGLMSTSAIAENIWFTSNIKMIYPTSAGTVILTFKDNSTKCTNKNKYHHIKVGSNGVTQDGLNTMMSVALSAATLGKPLTIVFDEASSNCYINRMQLKF